MSGRLPTHLAVSALLRRVNDAGGLGTVLARGDPDSGMVLIVAADRGGGHRLLERGFTAEGRPALVSTGPKDATADAVTEYWTRRRRADPDLWVIELDIADAERLAAETIGDG